LQAREARKQGIAEMSVETKADVSGIKVSIWAF